MRQVVTIGVDIANGFSKFTGSTLKGAFCAVSSDSLPRESRPQMTPRRRGRIRGRWQHERKSRLEKGGIAAQGASAEQRLLRLEAWAEVGTVPARAGGTGLLVLPVLLRSMQRYSDIAMRLPSGIAEAARPKGRLISWSFDRE
jgi:hypothetical protein